ncbi:MAG: saccharopine dehydrogenase [Marinilabiliales bacterium]|nr:MAG: saccharopine dehydrogenase [Marinilabiliales bacterium]
MKKKVLVLGCGLVGMPMAMDLAANNEYDVSVADIDNDKLQSIADKSIKTITADLLSEQTVIGLLKDFDFAVNATPGFMGFKTLEYCIKSKTDTIDIAFYAENPEDLHELAIKNDVRVICDIGVAPGMSNLLSGYAASKLDTIESLKIFVGGLPKVRTLPWEYKAVFSPTDVIEEYTRTARLVENGSIVEKPALTEIEHLEFDKIGTLEAFNSDGLRSLLWTIKAKNMYEKTLRYPGYANKIKLLADNGFFSSDKIKTKDGLISPLEMTCNILFDQWKLHDNETDITVMKIIAEGMKDGDKLRHTFDLYDEYDPNSGIHSMARTTGYTATVALRMLDKKLYKETGICFPEYLGKDQNIVDFMLSGLKTRNIIYKHQIEIL